jgi:hypothetical protein
VIRYDQEAAGRGESLEIHLKDGLASDNVDCPHFQRQGQVVRGDRSVDAMTAGFQAIPPPLIRNSVSSRRRPRPRTASSGWPRDQD